MSELRVRLHDGTRIVLPASLHAISTYVLLEQEAWFEKEAFFVLRLLKPGMTVIDIGANVGVYSLPLARAVGAGGAVYAYEPASEPRRFLEQSRTLNQANNLHIRGAALSDHSGEAHLGFGFSSELHSLAGGTGGETVPLTTLDAEDRSQNWRAPDFVKIDAEGEERRILEGGRNFFARHSPLVMFEVKAGEDFNKAAVEDFIALGYGIFRLLYGAPVLVPLAMEDAVDTYELNLFAAKPDRVSNLARDGWLVERVMDWAPDEYARQHGLDFIAAQAFGEAMMRLSAPAGSPYRDGLAAYAQWRATDAPLEVRYAALRFSYATLRSLCEAEPGLARLSSLARVAWELGERKMAVAALNQLLALGRKSGELTEPFWPADPRFDSIAPGNDVGRWFLVGTTEQLERIAGYSSLFVKEGINLDWLRKQPFVSAEIERRYMLRRLRAGERLPVPERLCRPAADHINSDLWRSGSVPNTLPSR